MFRITLFLFLFFFYLVMRKADVLIINSEKQELAGSTLQTLA